MRRCQYEYRLIATLVGRVGLSPVRCAGCGAEDTKVIDSRMTDEGSAIRRRRQCPDCGRRFTTFERVEEVPLTVRKTDGRRQSFDRAKIVGGVRSAVKGRPVSDEQIDALAEAVEEAVRLDGPDVTSVQVGYAVLERLRALDEVGYLRFASVYKGFDQASDFHRELELLEKAAAKS